MHSNKIQFKYNSNGARIFVRAPLLFNENPLISTDFHNANVVSKLAL
nr:MAG TPA: hypothetical protein [Caudoviricetes sp.]